MVPVGERHSCDQALTPTIRIADLGCFAEYSKDPDRRLRKMTVKTHLIMGLALQWVLDSVSICLCSIGPLGIAKMAWVRVPCSSRSTFRTSPWGALTPRGDAGRESGRVEI